MDDGGGHSHRIIDNSDDTTGLSGDVADTSNLCLQSSFVSNGSTEHVKTEDEPPDARTNAILEQLGNKIVRVRDLIRTEQKLRDGT